jgi:iron-sulfur cluster repair protein YtfE (RIC family)
MTSLYAAARVERRFVEEEHRRVRGGLAELEETLAEAHRLDRAILADRVYRTLEWLRRDVLPLVAWEDTWLFPVLDEAAGTSLATAALRMEHGEIVGIEDELEGDAALLRDHWSHEVELRIVARLASLRTMLASHLAKEERIALPLLERVAQPSMPTP